MVQTTQPKHPLENQFIIYHYGTQDYERAGWALALYRLRNGELNVIYEPDDHVGGETGSIGEKNIDQLLELMTKRKIKKVYSVNHLDDFFGIPAHWISLHDSDTEPEEIELWSEWKQIEPDSYEHNKLRGRGIEVIFYQEHRST